FRSPWIVRTPSSSVTFTSSFFTSGISALIWYPPSVSLTSTDGTQSATTIVSLPFVRDRAGRLNIRFNRSDMSSSSRNGSHRTSVMLDLLLVLIHCFRMCIRGARRLLCTNGQITRVAVESRGNKIVGGSRLEGRGSGGRLRLRLRPQALQTTPASVCRW